MTDEDKHIEQIYKKIIIKRQQPPPKPKPTFFKIEDTEWIRNKTSEMMDKLIFLWNQIATPKQDFEIMVKNFGKLLDFIRIHLDPEVIDVLVMDEMRKKFNKKVMAE